MKNSALIKLQKLSQQNTLPHAWLLTGPDNASKLKFVNEFAQWLLCGAAPKQAVACGTCKSCNLFVAQTHADFHVLTMSSKTIPIDDVRALNDFVRAKPQFAQYKVVLLYPAEAMHNAAANSLLKNLEDPAGNTIFFLLTKHVSLLLPTIVSRCQQLNFSVSATEPMNIDTAALMQIISDLNSLYVKKQLTANEIVDKWIKQWPSEVLYWFELVLADLILFKYTQDLNILKYTNLSVDHAALNGALSTSKLWGMLERLQQARSWFGANHKPNMQLVLEGMLLM